MYAHDVMAAILVFQNNETVAMLVYQTNPGGVQLFSFVNTYESLSPLTYFLVIASQWTETLALTCSAYFPLICNHNTFLLKVRTSSFCHLPTSPHPTPLHPWLNRAKPVL